MCMQRLMTLKKINILMRYVYVYCFIMCTCFMIFPLPSSLSFLPFLSHDRLMNTLILPYIQSTCSSLVSWSGREGISRSISVRASTGGKPPLFTCGTRWRLLIRLPTSSINMTKLLRLVASVWCSLAKD